MTRTSLKSFFNLVHYTDEDGYEHLLPMDYVSDSLLVADHKGHALHKGQKFAAWGYFPSLTVDGIYDIVFRTPPSATAYVHLLQFDGWVDGGQCRLQIYETPTTATSDTAFIPINRNRLSSRTSGVEIETSGTVTIGGAVQIGQNIFGGGTTKHDDSGAGDRESRSELVLNTSTTYVMRAINKSEDSSTVSVFMLWAEEEKGLET